MDFIVADGWETPKGKAEPARYKGEDKSREISSVKRRFRTGLKAEPEQQQSYEGFC